MRYQRFIPVLLLVPSVAAAQTVNSFQALAQTVVKILNEGAILMIAVALVIYFYNIVGDLWKINQGEAKSGAELRKTLITGLIILFVMISIWGIIQFLQYSLFGGPPPAATNGVIIYGN